MSGRSRSAGWLLVIGLGFLAGACRNEAPPGARAPNPDLIRVACVGDSITWGATIENRPERCYPAVLQRLLGDAYAVGNFGENGATALRDGDRPYWSADMFEAANAFAPDLVVLQLGTNDTKPPNWISRDRFAQDYRALVEHFAALPSRPRIWLMLPPPVIEDRWGVSGVVLRDEIVPVIREIAANKQLPLIDLHTPLRERGDWFPDRIHPGSEGAAFIAETVAKALSGT